MFVSCFKQASSVLRKALQMSMMENSRYGLVIHHEGFPLYLEIEVHAPFEDLFPHAVKAGGMVFVSGTLPWDKTGRMVDGGIKEHTVNCYAYNYDPGLLTKAASNH